MKAVTADQMRELERRLIASGTAAEVLMERAGYAVARTAVRFLKRHDARSVLLLAGKGNNGGDALVAARHLAAAGCQPTLALFCSPSELKGDAATHFQRMLGVAVVETPRLAELDDLVARSSPAVIIDGLLGTGLTGPARPPYADVIRWVNEQHLPVIAIDIPSGLDSDTGDPHDASVFATCTVTMGLPKIGLLRSAATDYVGDIEIADIGIAADDIQQLTVEAELITAADVARLIPPRRRSSHKGTYGHLLIVAGSEGYTGAPVICARAAARSGVGLVTLAVPATVYPIVAALCPPEIMPRPLERLVSMAEYDALAIGPGLGQSPDIQKQILHWIKTSDRPLVIDADGLNALAAHRPVLRAARAQLVLTPHPGEMARLIGKSTGDVQRDRWAVARQFAGEHRCVLALKGAGTVVTDAAGKLWINLSGNPGMARGGTGDALTGMIGALLARGLAPLDATRAAVYLHGVAGDLARDRHGEQAMLATDLIECIGGAFARLVDRPA